MNKKKQLFDVGTRLSLIKVINNIDNIYVSQLLDVIEPDELIISGPITKGRLVLVHKDEKLEICYNLDEKGKYCFDALVLSRNYSRIYTLRIKKISDIRKVQLRKYFRLPIALDVNKEFVSSDSLEVHNEKCEAKDISGGGLKLYCNYHHELDDIVDCSFKINGVMTYAKGKVVRVIDLVDNEKFKYNLGISFTAIKEFSRDEIIKYIFDQQRILRIKGLI